jgi:uncharacterized membrane-anchored protein YhcB (DUF1043 family)
MIAGLIIGFLVGLGCGIATVEFREARRQRETAEQMDARLVKELNYYRNLSESLMQDVKFLKTRTGDHD